MKLMGPIGRPIRLAGVIHSKIKRISAVFGRPVSTMAPRPNPMRFSEPNVCIFRRMHAFHFAANSVFFVLYLAQAYRPA